MKSLPKPLSAAEVAALTGGTVLGDADHRVTGVADLADATPADAAFLENRKYGDLAKSAPAGLLFVPPDCADMPCAAKARVVTPEPRAGYARLVMMIDEANRVPRPAGVSPRASVHPSAKLGEGVHVGDFAVVEAGAVLGDGTVLMPQVFVGANTTVGAGCLFYPGVVVREDCVIGARVILHPGCVIGADGFGFLTDKKTGRHTKIPQIGNVVIEDGVEIGANTTIDRGAVGSTLVKNGAQIDNLVQLGHNVRVGRDAVLVSQTGVAGSTVVGNNAILAGQAGVAGHLKIGDGAVVTAQTGVMSDVPPKTVLFGSPGRPHREAFKLQALYGRLPELFEKVKELEKRLGLGAEK
ncbi:MAG: UDP-3-O-(3-hydroxymyristoyl)glucosamine N-acyltransferase [Elusimicrobiota bacterium]|nr:UDP-3-O-(3-hydroxymyristoyl)glucosamine N-acyltransferase [Elusimicrobiota bacterium]